MIRIKVPATTANMGPGFDSLGTALSLYNETIFEEIEEGVIIDEQHRSKHNLSPMKNLIYSSFLSTIDLCGKSPKGVRISGVERGIPSSRGLGSSAACIVAGIMAANRMMGDPLSMEDMMWVATDLEGHPDNVVPAIVGGMTAAVREGRKIWYSRIVPPESLGFVAMIPDFRLGTRKSRKLLPRGQSRADCVYNVGRASLLVASIVSGDYHNLRTATGDKIHQPYRLKMIRGAGHVLGIARGLGSCAEFVSGGGPSIMALVSGQTNPEEYAADLNKALARMPGGWKAVRLAVDLRGAHYVDDANPAPVFGDA